MNIKTFLVGLCLSCCVPFLYTSVYADDYYSDTSAEDYITEEAPTEDPATEDTPSDDPVYYTESLPDTTTDTGTEVIVPDPGDITTPDDGSGDLASDNHVTIGGLDFGGFQIDLNLGDMGGTEIIEVVSSLPAEAATGLKATLEEVFGTYTPRMENVTYYSSDGTSYVVTRQVSGIAGVDFEWITTMILYGLCLYSFFRILGMVFERFS